MRNADPDVVHDMLCGFEKVFPAEQFFYQHAEGKFACTYEDDGGRTVTDADHP